MKTVKIYNDEKEVYSGNCNVNMALFRGRVCSDLREVSKGTVKFSLQLSNGKDKITGEWNKATFADCTAFGEIAHLILREYKPKDEIWVIAKYYSKQHDGKFYKGFVVQGIIEAQKHQKAEHQGSNSDFLPF